jgi:hypothetical protein
MKPFITVALLALAIAGCSPTGTSTSASGPAETKVLSNPVSNARDLWPASIGNAWTYTIGQVRQTRTTAPTSGTAEATLKLVGTKPVTGGVVATFKIIQENKERSTLVFQITDKGVFQISTMTGGRGGEFRPQLPALPWPMKVGEVKEWSGTGPSAGSGAIEPFKSSVIYKGESEVDTPAGRMNGLRVDSSQTTKVKGKPVTVTQSMWFVPKVGLVRSFEVIQTSDEIRQTDLRLKAYTVK